MVTMRRDVAVMNGNRVFDRPDRDAGLTEYDRFMQEKRRQESARTYGTSTVYNAIDANAQTNYFGYSDNMLQETKSEETYDDYDCYMKAQLHRTTGGKILTQGEFYADQCREAKASESRNGAKNAVRKRGLNKNGKIFVAVYVLVVMLVASIILAVNNNKGDNVERANAIQEGGIGALAMDTEEAETNWFDELCDSISNK